MEEELATDFAWTVALSGFTFLGKTAAKAILKGQLTRRFGDAFVERMLKECGDIKGVSKYVRQFHKLDYSDKIIREFSEAHGKQGLDWLLSRKGLGLPEDLVRKIPSTELQQLPTPKEIEHVMDNISDILISPGEVNMEKMSDLRKKITKGEFNLVEKKMISRKMAEWGVTEKFEEYMIEKMDFNAYLTNIIGPYPSNLNLDHHAHHLLFKIGNGEKQQALVKEIQPILREYGIDPIIGEEILVWARMRVKGQHHINALKPLAADVKRVKSEKGTYEDMVEVLNLYKKIAYNRK